MESIAPPSTRETITQKALRLYPERTVEPLGHGRYSVEGRSGNFYEVDLAVYDGEESCPCPATKPCYHIALATIYRAKARAKARRKNRASAPKRGLQRRTSRLWRRCEGDTGGAALRGPGPLA